MCTDLPVTRCCVAPAVLTCTSKLRDQVMKCRHLLRELLPLDLGVCDLLEQFHDRPVVFVREHRDARLEKFVRRTCCEHRNAIAASHAHRVSEIFVHRANVAAGIFELAIHDQFGTTFQQGAANAAGRKHFVEHLPRYSGLHAQDKRLEDGRER